MNLQLLKFKDSLLNSYGQIFFSDNPLFGFFLLAASFIDLRTGFAGFLSAGIAIVAANLFGLDPRYIKNGTFTFNSLLTGLALGTYFYFSATLLCIILLGSLFALMLASAFATIGSRLQLPFFSLPFILTTWLMLLTLRFFEAGHLIERLPGDIDSFSNAFSSLENVQLPILLVIYLKTLAAIFFQNSILSGILISTGLLIFSRIAFLLSWVGFVTGFVIFKLFISHSSEVEYSYTAFNYILAAVALGGYFLVPSLSSFIFVIITTPFIVLLASLSPLFLPIHLPIYSLPFSLWLLLLIAALRQRLLEKYLHPVIYQQYSPEKNLFFYDIYKRRFKKYTHLKIHLPFFGEWTVTQGYSGKITHKEDHSQALDFSVTDEQNKTFRLPGKSLNDFFCYELPVLAPAAGVISTVADGIEDNKIGEVNLTQNWGNSIVIKHGDHLYSKLSHLKNNSIKVKEGQQVKKGEPLALCGNSGRSPEPHLHFQLQTTDQVGANTISFPVSSYIRKKETGPEFVSFDVPREGEILTRALPDPSLVKAFNFITGQKINFQISSDKNAGTETWKVMSDEYSGDYLLCKNTQSRAYFILDETIFEFTTFSGKACLLKEFYLAAHKIPFVFAENLKVQENLDGATVGSALKPILDLLAPFFIYIQPKFKAVFKTGEKNPGSVRISSIVSGRGVTEKNFEINVENGRLINFKINTDKNCTTAINISE